MAFLNIMWMWFFENKILNLNKCPLYLTLEAHSRVQYLTKKSAIYRGKTHPPFCSPKQEEIFSSSPLMHWYMFALHYACFLHLNFLDVSLCAVVFPSANLHPTRHSKFHWLFKAPKVASLTAMFTEGPTTKLMRDKTFSFNFPNSTTAFPSIRGPSSMQFKKTFVRNCFFHYLKLQKQGGWGISITEKIAVLYQGLNFHPKKKKTKKNKNKNKKRKQAHNGCDWHSWAISVASTTKSYWFDLGKRHCCWGAVTIMRYVLRSYFTFLYAGIKWS